MESSKRREPISQNNLGSYLKGEEAREEKEGKQRKRGKGGKKMRK